MMDSQVKKERGNHASKSGAMMVWLAVALGLAAAPQAWTQSASARSHGASEPALGGACPVCLVEMGKEVPGQPTLRSVKDGKTYLFPSPDQKRMFDGQPEKYLPAFGGYCPVCQVEMNELVPGSPEHFSVHEGHLFLFATADQKKMFDQNPGGYSGVTLGLNGLCPVCLANGDSIQGKPEFATRYDGVEYRFPSQEIKDLFLQNPEKYVPVAGGQCLVCKVDMNQNVLGGPEHALIQDGKTWLFVDEIQKNKFQRTPSRYIKALDRGSVPKGGPVPSSGSSKNKAQPKRRAGGSGTSRR